jgi:predicted DCC family thiol-disulfide oxidoreductase YuxK
MESRFNAEAGQAIVLYDGQCEFCRMSAGLLRRLDWRHRLHFRSARDEQPLPDGVALDRERLLEQMHVLTPDRKQAHAGFEAFRWLAWRLPLTAALAPLLYVPGVPWLGSKVYRWVARNRFGLVPCQEGVCRVPLKYLAHRNPARSSNQG